MSIQPSLFDTPAEALATAWTHGRRAILDGFVHWGVPPNLGLQRDEWAWVPIDPPADMPGLAASSAPAGSVSFAGRPWAATPDYWRVFFDIPAQVKTVFDAEGLSIPFPQTDVHLRRADAA